MTKRGLRLRVRDVHESRDPPRAEREVFLQIYQSLYRFGPGRILQHSQISSICLDRFADAAAERVQHDAAAQRARIGLVADDEAIAGQRDDRVLGHELREGGRLGRDRACFIEHYRTRDRLCGADEQPHPRIAFESALGGRTNLEPRVETLGRRVEALVGEHVAAREVELLGAG